MKAALLQMVSGCEVQANLDHAGQLMRQAADDGAELAVLPEYFCLIGQQDSDKLAVAERFGDGPMQSRLAHLSHATGLWLVAGSLPLAIEADAHHVRNACLVFNPQGNCVARYDKIHLFHFDNGRERYDERLVLQAGETPVCFDLPSRDGHTWRIGLSICFDVRFPTHYQQLCAMGAELMLVPSAFTHTTGSAHWEVLMRARALDNLVWVGAAAQGGVHDNGRQTWGHSMWVDPWGAVVASMGLGSGCVLAELDIAQLRDRRAQLPALSPTAP
ncbi:MAG: carbon-nitrogen hydrolase family protein [Betaproteobacteria bacterium]|nr:carbon-nitrogen hydrolase family protein [Betaproteobacteria bacterium]